MWLAWASRPSLRALSHHFTYSYDATVSGTAYTDHGKSAVGRPDGAHRAGARLVSSNDTSGGKGLTPIPAPVIFKMTTGFCASPDDGFKGPYGLAQNPSPAVT